MSASSPKFSLVADEVRALEEIEAQCTGVSPSPDPSAPPLDPAVWDPVFKSLPAALSGDLPMDAFWNSMPLSQGSQDSALRVRGVMEATVSASQRMQQTVSNVRHGRGEESDNLTARTAFNPTQDRAASDWYEGEVPAPAPVWADGQAGEGDQLRIIRTRQEAQAMSAIEGYDDSDDTDFDDDPLPLRLKTPPSAQPRLADAPIEKYGRSESDAIRQTAETLAILSSAETLATLGSAPRRSTETSSPGVADEAWPLKAELRGTEAHHYRGPLTPDKVLALLDAPISDNGRQSLTGERAGYLKYFHFLGNSVVPDKRRRSNDSSKEGWKCRSCHTILHAPMAQVSNLGTHLYGKIEKGRPPRTGCLDARRDVYAEAIPIPERDLSGALIRNRAGKPSRISGL